MSEPITMRAYRPGDEAGILRGHNLTFQPQRSMAHWHWKFRHNPAGVVTIAVAEHETEGIVGAYVTLPVRVLVEGQPKLAGQCVDLFVLPEHRRYGPRPGLFVNLALHHYELFGGKGPGKTSFHYGWPIATWRIGQKYLRYEMVRDWDFLFAQRPAHGFAARGVPGDLVVQKASRAGADVDALWAQLQGQSQLQIVRDAAYLNWRYADAHDAVYELLECRERQSGRLRGLAVLTRRDLLFPGTVFLADWLVPADDYDATLALVAAAERRTDELGAPVLATLFQHLDPRFLHFQHLGFKVYGTSYFQVVIPFDQQDTLFYKDHWYHTLGDSDLV